jgi:signal transduction histidine kinase
LNSEILLAIERDSRMFGILSLGTQSTIPSLQKDDIDLFLSITSQMAIALENNEYIRRSTELIKKLTEAEVREKYLKELEATNKQLDSKNQDLQKLYNELKNTQAQLIHSEKMASLGQLVAGISHELNNPIGFIYSNIKQLNLYTNKIEHFIQKYNKAFKDKQVNEVEQIEEILPDIKNLIEDTINGSQMIKELVDNLRSFSHLDQAKWSLVDIHEGIESSIKILLSQFKEKIKINKKFNAKGVIECNPGQLNQVFLNLLANAAQAVKAKGNIWIETSDEHGQIKIEIRDDGEGMPDEILGKIFDPFFTTKDVGEGTGLGLSISYSIVKNHGGRLNVKSQLGEGSIFTITLPYNSKKHAEN